MRTLHTPLTQKRIAIFCLCGIFACVSFGTIQSAAQSNGDFRSRKNGRWNRNNTWEEFQAGSWQNTNNQPNINSGLVTIRAPHNVQANKRGNFDQIVIEAGAELETTQIIKILDGPGVDLEVFGDLIVNRTTRITQTSSALFHPGSYVEIRNLDRLRFENTATATFDNTTILVDGHFQPEDDSNVFLTNGTVLTANNQLFLRNRGHLSIAQSTIINRNVFNLNNSATAVFEDGGLYIHDRDGGNFSQGAKTTWQAGSEARITGVINTLPSRLNHTFHHLTWDNTGQSADLDLAGAPIGVTGNLTIESTKGQVLTWDAAGSDLLVGLNYTQNGGILAFSDVGSSTMTVSGDFDVSAGTFVLAGSSGTPTLAVGGNFTVASSFTETGTGFGTILLASSATQTINAPATLSGNLDLRVSGTGTALLVNNLFVPGHFLETSGGLDLAGFNVEIEGDFGVSSALSNPAQLMFSGASPSQMQIPAASSVLVEVLIDKAGSSLSLLSDLATSTTTIIRNGTLDVNGFVLTIPHGATLYNRGTVLGVVKIERNYTQNSDGWRMLATPVSGVNYSDLNASFWTQGAPWAKMLAGTSNLQSFVFSTQYWSPLGGADAGFSPSLGYIFYMYALDGLGSSILPATWSVTGAPSTLASQSLQFATGVSDSYNLMGNPSTTNIDWNATHAGSTDMEPSYATWDPAVTSGGGTTGYKYYDSASGIGAAGRYIAPFTAFMVAASASGAQISFASSEAAARQSAVYFGKGGNNDGEITAAPHIRLLLEGKKMAEDEIYFSFGDEATDETNIFDVERLNPLSADFATLYSRSRDRKLAFDGRTMESGREIYDLALAVTKEGVYELSLRSRDEIPEGWTISLVDLKSGNRSVFSQGETMRFQTTSDDMVTLNHGFDADRHTRFRLVIEDPSRAGVDPGDAFFVENTPVLTQNYPNPFNPSTTIRFSIPESNTVSLDVFDMLGRQVATLFDKRLDAGWHETEFSAAGLASGLYIYRLVVGDQVFSKHMLLLK